MLDDKGKEYLDYNDLIFVISKVLWSFNNIMQLILQRLNEV